MTVTIRDVARQAGTSTATVSHVPNSTGRITGKTRRRVLTAIKTLKYHPNLRARNLALGKIIAEPNRRAILSLLVFVPTVGGRDRASTSSAAADGVKAPASAARGRFRRIHGGR